MKRTDEQVAQLILKVMSAVGEPMAQDEIGSVVDWIANAETDRAILTLFEQGKVALRWVDGELTVIAR